VHGLTEIMYLLEADQPKSANTTITLLARTLDIVEAPGMFASIVQGKVLEVGAVF
jgi:hypothetical protein